MPAPRLPPDEQTRAHVARLPEWTMPAQEVVGSSPSDVRGI